MVGVFPQLSGQTRTNPSFLDTKEGRAGEREESGEKDFDGNIGRGGKIVEFKPVEHPLEPEDDRPVICPMPDSSLLKRDDGIWKELFAKRLEKSAETIVVTKGTTDDELPSEAVHTIARDSANRPTSRAPQHNFFQVFQQCREFEF